MLTWIRLQNGLCKSLWFFRLEFSTWDSNSKGLWPRWLTWIHTILNTVKTQIIINGITQGYFRCKRGLRKGDPLSPFLFALPANVFSTMFNHAFTSKALIGVKLDQSKSICHLQYANDLIILSVGGQEDFHITKLILYLFKGSYGLSINYLKNCLYSTNYDYQPNIVSAMTLNCNRDCLPITYLGVPLLGRWPRRQDWAKLTGMVSSRLTPWKAIYLSLGGCLTLINLVLSTIPVYYISVFKLPTWVIQEIDKIRRDFLWKGLDLRSKGVRLVA